MKKICIITTVAITLESFVVETAINLYKTEGYDITLICDHNPDFAASLPEYLHYIPVKMGRGIDFKALGSIKELYKILKKGKFDLVQYSTPNASCYASIAAFLARIPVRIYAQWGIRYVGLGGFSRKIFKFIEKIVCRLSTNIRAVSFKNMQFAIDEKLYKSEKASVIGNGGTIGVDMTDYDLQKKEAWRQEIRNKYALSESDFVFGFVGRISADKGCFELLESFKNLSAENENLKLMIIGPKEDNCSISKDLLDWADKSKAVIFTDLVAKRDMKAYYSAIDVLVHPTYREGFGMVIQEAGALAIPVITTDIPGASEVMENGVSCMLVEPKNTSELQSAMKFLAETPEKVSQLGDAAFKRTKELYARPIMLENQRIDYKKLLSGE